MKALFTKPNHSIYLCLITTFTLLISATSIAQQMDKELKSFRELRKKEFVNLLGGVQEGIGVSYLSDKTVIDGSVGFGIDKWNSMVQVKGNVGTTTNLSTLFTQKTLPTFSIAATYHWLITGGASKYFYDGNFSNNFAAIGDDSKELESITTNSKFTYSNVLREKIQEGKIKPTETLYTHRRLLWLSLTGKYDNSKYSFYDQSQPFAAQVTDPLYQAWNSKVTINGYWGWNKTDVKWFRPKFIYVNAGIQYGLGNNIQQLKKVTINDISSSTVNGTTTRQTVKSSSLYNGTYKEFNTLTPSFEFILSPIKYVALTAFGEYNSISKADKQKYNIDSFGSIASGIYFYDAKNINIGVFYKWTKDNATDTWAEQIGLKTSIPITPGN